MTRRVLGGDGMPAALPFVLFLELVSLGATLPVIAFYVEALGGDAWHTTFSFFLLAAPKVILQPLWGGLSDTTPAMRSEDSWYGALHPSLAG